MDSVYWCIVLGDTEYSVIEALIFIKKHYLVQSF